METGCVRDIDGALEVKTTQPDQILKSYALALMPTLFITLLEGLNIIPFTSFTESVSLEWVLNKIWDEVCIPICDGGSH